MAQTNRLATGGRPYETMQVLGLMYLSRKAEVMATTLGPAILADHELSNQQPSEQGILSEAAWVVLSVGLSARVVASVHCQLTPHFFGWQSAYQICYLQGSCRKHALRVFSHRGKIDAIIQFAEHLSVVGTDQFLKDLQAGTATDGLPYFGPASTQHLRLNLGISTVKADRHLKRLAAIYSCDVPSMCDSIAAYTGDELRLIDRVLWTHATHFRLTAPGVM